MVENNNMLNRLQQLLKHKQSKSYYSQRLGISIEEVEALLKELRRQEVNDTLDDLGDLEVEDSKVLKFEEDIKNNKAEITLKSNEEIRTLDELIDKCKIDTNKWEISRYVQNYWGNKQNPHWQVKAWLSGKEDKDVFQQKFIEFLKDFAPSSVSIKVLQDNKKPRISLILPKQDAHFNKYDINGKNNIEDRFEKNYKSTHNMIRKASSTNYIEEIVYIVGSDQFNSEWTSLTTKGTPQSNILSYQEAFKLICEHEIGIIQNLTEHSERVKVMFIPGNHDEYVGWHLINLLETYFRNDSCINFDSSTLNTKYYKYGNTAVMLNHGDAIKPKDLAQKFPIGFKEQWSSCDHYTIITGDKHHEMSLDIHGIKFYQLPQLSSSISKWDDKQGYTDSKAEMTAFVVTEHNGISDIYKELL